MPVVSAEYKPTQHTQVDYPETAGMLHKLLAPISPRWDITLLHFRKTGQRAATALLGLRLPAGDKAAFAEAVAGLSGEVSLWLLDPV